MRRRSLRSAGCCALPTSSGHLPHCASAKARTRVQVDADLKLLVLASMGVVWLFVRGEDSIWIERVGRSGLLMCGPSVHRSHKDFREDGELRRFLEDAEQRLLASGWTLQRLGLGEDRRLVKAASPPRRERRAG